MTSTPDADARLLEVHDLALQALREITPASTIGPAAGYLAEDDGSVSLRFANRLPGYPGWYWTVTVARVDDEEPTVLELELLPGDGALLAPEWVPWAERLAEYRAHRAELAEKTAELGEGDAEEPDDGSDEIADELDDDDDDSASDILHAGDLDGVDIDELDVSDDFDEDGSDDEGDDSDDEGDDSDDEDDDSDGDDDEDDDSDDEGDDEEE